MTDNKEKLEKVRAVRITQLLGIKESGRRQNIRCPFHGEKTPSCVIFPDNTFHCFGCGAHGNNAIDFVMKLGCNFVEAVKELEQYV